MQFGSRIIGQELAAVLYRERRGGEIGKVIGGCLVARRAGRGTLQQ